MKLQCESQVLEDYLAATEEVDYYHPAVNGTAAALWGNSSNETEFVKHAFEYVRDQISHSWDIQSPRVTCSASEVLHYKEGICYAKSNLLCAILRSRGIPTGFCYQRLTLGDTPDTGYCIHALNAVYFKSIDRWIRIDSRGNKAGIDAQFSIHKEKLAFLIRAQYDEKDYPIIYTKPNLKTIKVLKESTDCIEMYLHGLPTDL